MIGGIWADAPYEPEEFIEAGDFVVVAVRAKARGRGGGVPMDVPIFQVFEMQDGRCDACGLTLIVPKLSKP